METIYGHKRTVPNAIIVPLSYSFPDITPAKKPSLMNTGASLLASSS